MKMTLMMALGAVVALGGCVTVPQGVQLPAGQALLVAEAGMDGANHAATIAANGGVFAGHPDTARSTHAAVDAGNNAVSAAHTLYAKGDIPGTISQLNEALKDVAAIEAASKPVTTGAKQ